MPHQPALDCPAAACLAPARVAVVGASRRRTSPGWAVWQRLRTAGFGGALWPLNPKYWRLNGLPCWAQAAHLPAAPDLALVCSPAHTVPGVLQQLAACGTPAAVVLTPGADCRNAPPGLQMLGPGAGLALPPLHLWGSPHVLHCAPGPLALVAADAALANSVLDAAAPLGLGFAAVLCLGHTPPAQAARWLHALAQQAGSRAVALALTPAQTQVLAPAISALAAHKPVLLASRHTPPPGALAVPQWADLAAAAAACLHRPAPAGRCCVLSNSAAAQHWLKHWAPAQPLQPQAGPVLPAWAAPADWAQAIAHTLQAQPSPVLALVAIHPAACPSQTARAICRVLADHPQHAARLALAWLGQTPPAVITALLASAGIRSYAGPEQAVHALCAAQAKPTTTCRQ